MNWLVQTLRQYPEIAVFLVVGSGAVIGKIKLGSTSLGTVTGALFAGLLVGQLNIPVAASAKAILYLLFLVGNGYSIGPQFFRSLKGEGIRYLALALFQCSVGLFAAVTMARLLHLDVGMAAGLLSGALTQSPAIGTASETISALPLPQEQRTLLIAHVAIADALTYLFGTAGTIWFLSLWAPKMLRIQLPLEAKKLEAQLHIDRPRSEFLSTYTPFALRAYRVRSASVSGKRVCDFEAVYPGNRFYVEQVRHGAAIVNAPEETVLQPEDVVALSGRRSTVIEVGAMVGEEVDDRELLDMPGGVQTITVNNPAVIGKPLEELSLRKEARGVYLRRIRRIGLEIPILPGTELHRGDEVELVGTEASLKRITGLVGMAHKSGAATDVAAVCLAVFAGGLIGAPFVVVHGFRLSLGTAVGALVAGIVLGWLHSVRPTFGRVPEAASSLMISLGLAAFVGMNGLQAGAHFVAAFKAQGLPLVLGGVVVTLVPLVCGVFFGRYVLKLNPVLLLGACAGAQTVTAALAEVQEKSASRTPVLGYTVPYAIGNIVLTIWGSIIVTLHGVLTNQAAACLFQKPYASGRDFVHGADQFHAAFGLAHSPSGVWRICVMVQRTLASTASASCSPGSRSAAIPVSAGSRPSTRSWMRDRSTAPWNFAASAALTAPHPSCPSTTRSGVFRWTPEYCRLPATSGESIFPATRTTNKSPKPAPKISSGGTRESLQPRIIAYGCWCVAISARVSRDMEGKCSRRERTWRCLPLIAPGLHPRRSGWACAAS